MNKTRIRNSFALEARSSFAATVAAATLCALALPSASLAYTVYDAGKALHQNITSASPVGANGETYTDENGGKWQYLRANDREATTTVAFNKSVTSGTYRGIGGNSSGAGSPFIHVNVSGNAQSITGAEPVEPDEFYAHPGDASAANHYIVVRFIVPEAGWYSAFLTAHDVSKGTALASAGAEVSFVANNDLQARSVVSLEDYDLALTNNTSRYLLTHRFDFQMPVRWMAADETLDVVIGANGAHASDATGFKMIVTKEDDGAFYDSGRALNENLSGSSLNPFGTASLGMWYCGYLDTSDPQSQSGFTTGACPASYFATWAPGQLTKKLTLFDSNSTRTSAPKLRGFFMSDSRHLKSPYICVNQTEANDTDVAPRELYAHPYTNWTQWATLRFRPTRSGVYSASVVLRDVVRNADDNDSDGVMAYLLVAEKVVTNAVVSAESFNASAHFTFGARLVAANEPIDIVISPHNGHASDATTISAIFRREADAYDAGYSVFASAKANGTAPARPFADVHGGGATWKFGQTQSAKDAWSYVDMPYAFKRVVDGIDYFGYGQNSTDGSLPRVMISTNGVAQVYTSGDSIFFRMTPCEFWVHPNNSGKKCPVVRAAVPEAGIYHARAYARHITRDGNGVYAALSIGGSIPSLYWVSRTDNGAQRESAIDGDRLWLRANETIDAVIDPIGTNHSNDGTGFSVCCIKEGDVDTGTRVVNVHITQGGSGILSPTTQRPREGWSNWTTWNALRPGTTASAERRDCYDGDGTTQRNVTVRLTRDSGSAIAYGNNSAANIYSYAVSTNADDTYTFTIGKLKKTEPYSLYLYGAKDGSTGGNATFTVGGVTKSLDETWINDGGIKTLTRFDTVSNSDGEITGTFAAADSNGGVFNGLSLVGDFPAYIPEAFVITVR